VKCGSQCGCGHVRGLEDRGVQGQLLSILEYSGHQQTHAYCTALFRWTVVHFVSTRKNRLPMFHPDIVNSFCATPESVKMMKKRKMEVEGRRGDPLILQA